MKNDNAGPHNVLIEMLPTGTLGLPQAAEPLYTVRSPSGVSAPLLPSVLASTLGFNLPHLLTDIPLLHPSVVILTKLKRWYTTLPSTRPKTMLKHRSDEGDIDYMVHWLARIRLTIQFWEYRGKRGEELMRYVRTYLAEKVKNGSGEGVEERLRGVIERGDWEVLEGMEVGDVGGEDVYVESP